MPENFNSVIGQEDLIDKNQPLMQENGKIVNLFEDMRTHTHDEESYQKMRQERGLTDND